MGKERTCMEKEGRGNERHEVEIRDCEGKRATYEGRSRCEGDEREINGRSREAGRGDRWVNKEDEVYSDKASEGRGNGGEMGREWRREGRGARGNEGEKEGGKGERRGRNREETAFEEKEEERRFM